jgi:16S rRNA (adenine1518-N6/adenine1519-N6)-dimethyltransferase
VTLTRRQVADLLEDHGLAPSRALGQNFVVDPNTVRRIAWLAGVGPGDRVVEIGAGLGSLTLALADTGADVTAIELDTRLVPILREVVPATVRVVEGDARRLDWATLLDGPAELVANLPYNVATPLVLDLLDEVPAIGRMLVMVQREAGERLAAGPGSASYGIPSVKVAFWAKAELVGSVPPTVFLPQPRVSSVLVRIVRRDRPAVDADPTTLFRLVSAAFGQRRKMLRRSLADIVSVEQFAAAGIDPQDRPERLGIDAWGRLATAVGTS